MEEVYIPTKKENQRVEKVNKKIELIKQNQREF